MLCVENEQCNFVKKWLKNKSHSKYIEWLCRAEDGIQTRDP